MQLLTLTQASAIVDAVLEEADTLKLKPITAAVLDAGGHLLALKRQDGSSIMRPRIAEAKAWGSLAMGIGGRSLAQRAATDPSFVAALGDISGGRIAPVPGGVLILDQQENVIGALGVTGDLSDNDEICAIAAIEGAGFRARC